MGVWGPGNFSNDTALDFVGQEIVNPLTARLRQVVKHPSLADPSEGPDCREVMAAVEILAVVCEGINAHPPPTDLVEQCRELCLRGWDEGSAKLGGAEEYIQERRSVIAATFDRLLTICHHWDELRS